MFDELQQEWAPLDDAVFQLTLPTFHKQEDTHYTSLGCPAISKGTLWSIYTSLLGCFRASSVDPVKVAFVSSCFHSRSLTQVT